MDTCTNEALHKSKNNLVMDLPILAIGFPVKTPFVLKGREFLCQRNFPACSQPFLHVKSRIRIKSTVSGETLVDAFLEIPASNGTKESSRTCSHLPLGRGYSLNLDHTALMSDPLSRRIEN